MRTARGVAMFRKTASQPASTREPGRPSPRRNQRVLRATQATSGGSLLSFTTGNIEVSRFIVERTKLFNITVSFGSTSSLISLPCYMSHASIPKAVREARGLPDDLVR